MSKKMYVISVIAILSIFYCEGGLLDKIRLPKTEITEQHRNASYNDQGIWQKRTEWKARWVKEWCEKKILFPVWKKVWGPVEIHEWIPLPKLPPWNPYESYNDKTMNGI